MAYLERANIQPMIPNCSDGNIEWTPLTGKVLTNVPCIFFSDGEPWQAANKYALSKAQSVKGNNSKTVLSNMNHLKGYADWLEDNNIDWRCFPKKKKDRCLFLYRGHLIEQRDSGVISPSTATSRMAAIIRFYRWAKVYGWVEKKSLWEDQNKILSFINSVGFERTMSVTSSELSIPNRARPGLMLEDGLTPLLFEDRDVLIQFLRSQEMTELYLMFLIGFFSGARSETIRTLRLSNVENALDDSSSSVMKRIHVGPGTKVKTKFDISGCLLFPEPLLNELQRYMYSPRRLVRQSLAREENKALLFLTERGNPYSDTSFTKIMSYLREKLISHGLTQYRNLKFHQSRATYGTQLMTYAMKSLSSQVDAIVFVRDAMLHKDESVTWKYIKFIEREPIKEKLSEEFFNLFTGNSGDVESLIKSVTYE